MSAFRLTPDARESLKRIAYNTQQQWGEKQRRKYLKALDTRFHTLAKAPLSGKPRPALHPELRSYLEGSHIVYYLPRKGYIIIVNVLHRRMDPQRHLHIE